MKLQTILCIIFYFLRKLDTIFHSGCTNLPAVLNMYNLIRNLQTVLQSGSTILHHYHQGMRILVDSHPYQHLLLSVLWMLAIRKGMLWYLLVFLICSPLIKRHLLLGRKVMTNIDSILKSRDIILPTKVCLVKAMVFPVVIYGCETWTVKKAECQKIDAFELWCWRKLLRVP